MDYELELVFIPVTDVDRAKEFYVDKVGFHADVDQSPTDSMRFVQCTPPGSACSIAFGTGLTDAVPGSARATTVVVADADAARAELAARGVAVSEVDEQPWARFARSDRPLGGVRQGEPSVPSATRPAGAPRPG